MSNREPIITTIFCIMGKPGSGRSTLVRYILDDSKFVEKINLNKLVYGTTRPMKATDIEGETFFFMSKEEFDNIDTEEIIESRSYDTIYNEVYEYFTLKDYINLGKTYILKSSVFQYEEYKKWADLIQLKYPMVQIYIYPIIIHCPIFERHKRLINKASTEDDVYKICTEIVRERYEFNEVAKNNPEITDIMNTNTLVLENSTGDKKQLLILKNDIEKFIEKKLILQAR